MQLDEGVESRDHLPDDECMHLIRAMGVRAMIDVSLQGCSYSGESPEMWRPKQPDLGSHLSTRHGRDSEVSNQ